MSSPLTELPLEHGKAVVLSGSEQRGDGLIDAIQADDLIGADPLSQHLLGLLVGHFLCAPRGDGQRRDGTD